MGRRAERWQVSPHVDQLTRGWGPARAYSSVVGSGGRLCSGPARVRCGIRGGVLSPHPIAIFLTSRYAQRMASELIQVSTGSLQAWL